MPKDNVVDFKKPEPFVDDPITEVLRTGAKKLLAEALEAEVESFCANTGNSGTTKAEKGWSAMDIFLSAVFKQGLGQLQLRSPVPEIFKQILNRGQFGLNPLYCLLTCEKPEAWRD